MSEIKDGGPAFPTHPEEINDIVYQSNGLTQRQWFAGKALQGMLANFYSQGFPITTREDYAVSAFRLADAMIKQSEVKS